MNAADIPTKAELRTWVAAAGAGESTVYHTGYLASDREAEGRLGPAVQQLADEAMRLAELGTVTLTQRRVHGYDRMFVYRMERTRKPWQ